MSDLFIGIDPSYSGLGLVTIDATGSVFDVARGSFPKAKYGDGVDRLDNIEAWLNANLPPGAWTSRYNVRYAIEGYAFGTKNGREQAGELQATIKLNMLRELGLYPTIVQPTAVKKFATGKGTGVEKNAMQLAVYKKWGVETGDDDTTDAYVLARIARDVYLYETEGKIPDLAYEHDVIQSLFKNGSVNKR